MMRLASASTSDQTREPGRTHRPSPISTASNGSGVDDREAIRRPRESARLLHREVAGEPDLVRTVGIHRVELSRTVAVRQEREPPSVRGPRRIPVRRGVVGESNDVRAVGIRQIDLGIARSIGAEGDPRPVRRPVEADGRTGPARHGMLGSAFDIDDVQLIRPRSPRREPDQATVRRPRRRPVQRRIVRQPARRPGAEIEDVDVEVARLLELPLEDQPTPVR